MPRIRAREYREIEGRVLVPPSSFESPGSDFSPNIVTVFQRCPQSGVFFLGELDKYVPLSPKRFMYVTWRTSDSISCLSCELYKEEDI